LRERLFYFPFSTYNKYAMEYLYEEQFRIIDGQELRLELISFYPGDEQQIPYYWYQIVRKKDGAILGKISLRLGYNYHSYYNGNIGYEIEEPYRGHHYSKEASLLLFPLARHYRMSYLIITTDFDNLASRKIIESLRGVLKEIVELPKDYFAYQPDSKPMAIYRLEI
jgi:predicted acetyltransferase